MECHDVGIPNKVIDLARISMKSSSSAIRIGGKLSTFSTKNNDSSLLINIALDKLRREVKLRLFKRIFELNMSLF